MDDRSTDLKFENLCSTGHEADSLPPGAYRGIVFCNSNLLHWWSYRLDARSHSLQQHHFIDEETSSEAEPGFSPGRWALSSVLFIPPPTPDTCCCVPSFCLLTTATPARTVPFLRELPHVALNAQTALEDSSARMPGSPRTAVNRLPVTRAGWVHRSFGWTVLLHLYSSLDPLPSEPA